MTTQKTIKIGVLSSLIATVIFLYLLDPIISMASRFFIFLFEFCSSSMQDRLYKEIALGKTDFAFTGIMMFIIPLISFSFIFVLRNIIKRRKISDNQIDDCNMIGSLSAQPLFRIFLNNSINIVSSLFFIIFISIFFSFSFLKINTIDRFEQHIKILTPYISSKDKDLLVSEFSAMSTKKDYVVIYQKIYFFASKNNIKLPETINYLY